MQKVETLLCQLIWYQLQSMFFFQGPKLLLTHSSSLASGYEKWFAETLEILHAHGFLKREGEFFQASSSFTLKEKEVWEDWERVKQQGIVEGNEAGLRLLDTTLKALPKILTGKVSATDVIFPNSSMELVESVYKQDSATRSFNLLLANRVLAYFQEQLKKESHTKIKIFEVGAGTGASSIALFQVLRPFSHHIEEYCYTDLSKAFLWHAQQNYGAENPYLKCQIFDVEKPLDAQGIKGGTYDLVIAANVLHATKNIRQTLRHVKGILKRKGVLLLNEISNKSLFSHLTFGLLEGWWRYEDPDLRISGSPALSSETWQNVLNSEGFHPVIIIKEENGQQLIAAASDGLVRQRLIATRATASQQKKTVENTDELQRALPQGFIKQALSKTLKLDPEKIDSNTPFDRYGLDSILQMSFLRELESKMGELPKTLIFEFPTVNQLTAYFTQAYSHVFLAQPEKSTPSLEEETYKRERLTTHHASVQKTDKEEIAIIGMSGRYPLSINLARLWENLTKGQNCLTTIPSDRREIGKFSNFSNSAFNECYGGFLDDIDRFDHQLFKIPESQVMEMVPELRLFLEIVWATFENAEYSQEKINHWQEENEVGIGTFVGNMYNQYFWNIPSIEESILSSNGSDWHIANRVSHLFNLTGPSIALNTACSSSLHAIHLACESLKAKSCSMAIAGGVNLTLNLSKYQLLERARFLGKGDKSKSFGMGDGLIPAEGVGAVLLKPLTQAIRDKDYIYAVIKSSFVSHGGGRQMYTAPDPLAQSKLITLSLKKAQVLPETIGYVEAAANGSLFGDSIEFMALQKAFRQATEKKHFCALGSIKSNLGHLEAASGVAQLHKVILQLQHVMLVPTLHAEPLNPHIKLEGSPFFLQERAAFWAPMQDPVNSKTLPRRSMINSFGAGGSYANVIVEEYQHPSAIKKTYQPNYTFNHSLSFAFPRVIQSALTFSKTYLYDEPYLHGHQINGRQVLVGAIYVSLIVQAFYRLFPSIRSGKMSKLIYVQPVVVGEGEKVELHVDAAAPHPNEYTEALEHSSLRDIRVRFRFDETETWREAATTQLQHDHLQTETIDIERMIGQSVLCKQLKDLYSRNTLVHWGKIYQIVSQLYVQDNYVFAQVCLNPISQGQNDEFLFITNSLYLIVNFFLREQEGVFLPFGIQEFCFKKSDSFSSCWIYAKLVKSTEELKTFDASILLETGEVIATYKGFSLKKAPNSVPDTLPEKIENYLIQQFAQAAGSPSQLINSKVKIMSLGISSMQLIELVKKIGSEIKIDLHPTLFFEYPTFGELTSFLYETYLHSWASFFSKNSFSSPASITKPAFPELVALNQEKQLPIFWFHGLFGGVENYRSLAKKIQRPFYGLQAKPVESERVSSKDIPSIANHYLKIIQTVQPHGPYDLGGFSLGGMLAYEVARYLQEEGQTVRTIVMIDSPDQTKFFEQPPSSKTLMLQAVNMLISSLSTDSQTYDKKWISSEELDVKLEEVLFFQQLIKCARERGLPHSNDQIKDYWQRHVKQQHSYNFQNYNILPLTKPNELDCYFLRNKSGVFFGKLLPYFVLTEELNYSDSTIYWERWKQVMPRFHPMDIPSENHMSMLSEPESLDTISNFCAQIYASL